MSREIFALDIGTRKVMGMVASLEGETAEILDVEVIEHPRRPMFDGQIHSIEEVAKTVSVIKQNLESRLEKKLKEVGIAVAGRNLITCKSKVVKDLGSEQEVTQDMISGLELEAVENILRDSGKNLIQFYCVGYSPLYYELEGEKMAILLGHRASSISVEVIATFLPRVVLDSMFAVLKKAQLEPINITLEPISALAAIIPPEMRNLNIALVDIGAGTSDLAIIKDGYVYAYGMVAEAGDEITEFISQLLLTDFSNAECIKRVLDTKKEIEYEDIWLRKKTIEASALKGNLLPVVSKLAASIAKVAIDLNGGKPQAVVVVGGGSLTACLMEELSRQFGIDSDKVGIRLPNAIKNIRDLTGKLSGPESVTPIGIALMTAGALGLRFIDIEVNGRKSRMLDFKQKKDVMGALSLSGVMNAKKLYPRPGISLTVEVNGELKIIKGTLGSPANILLNGIPVSTLCDEVVNGDRIDFQEALDGKDGSACVKDIVRIDSLGVLFNEENLFIYPPVLMDGSEVALDACVYDRARIQTLPLKVRDVLKQRGFDVGSLSERQILVNVNGVPKMVTQRNFCLSLNGGPCDLDTELQRDDRIRFLCNEPTHYRIRDVIEIAEDFDRVRVNVDGKDIDILIEPVQIFMNGQQVKPDEFLIDGADIKVYYLQSKQIILSEIFKYIEFDPYKGLGKNIRILVNDEPAGFTTLLKEGSRVRIIFEDRG